MQRRVKLGFVPWFRIYDFWDELLDLAMLGLQAGICGGRLGYGAEGFPVPNQQPVDFHASHTSHDVAVPALRHAASRSGHPVTAKEKPLASPALKTPATSFCAKARPSNALANHPDSGRLTFWLEPASQGEPGPPGGCPCWHW